MRYSAILWLLSLCVVSNAAFAQTAVPYTFSSGTPAKASEVNANFQALATAIDGLATRVNKLEGQITSADIVGTYTSRIHQVGVQQGTGATEAITYEGSLTFAADGTFTSTSVGHVNDVGGPSTISEPFSGAWSVSGNTVTITLTGQTTPYSFFGIAGGRLLISTIYGVDTTSHVGSNNLMILVRSN